MSEIEIGKIAFVKLSGEPVFVLSKEIVFEPGSRIPPAIASESFKCRRFIRSDYGSNYKIDLFTEPELETEADFRKKFEEEEARVMKQFAAQGGEIVVEGVPPSSKENLA